MPPTPLRWSQLVGVGLGLSLLSGCQGTLDAPQGAVAGPGNATTDGGSARLPPSLHGAPNGVDPAPSRAPLRRLTAREYTNTVRDLFPGVNVPSVSFPPPTLVSSFDNNALSLPPTSILAESEMQAADAIAQAVVAERDRWLSCAGAGDLACASSAVDALLRPVYRRPPTADERTRALEFVKLAFEAGGFTGALTDLVQALLLSPQFLYRLETGGSADAELIALDDYELATRLSYFLWQTMPDRELAELANQGKLSLDDTLIDQAERLLADPRAKAVVADFHRQWLELDRLDKLSLDPKTYPELDAALRGAYRSSLEAYVDWAFWNQHSVASLFTSERLYASGELAQLLQLPSSGSAQEAYQAEQRRGLLTQPGWLASTSHGTLHSPVLRGVQLLRKFLCYDIPPPPPGVNTALPELPSGVARTTREHFEQTHSKASCTSCHDTIDQAGFLFESYDALGRYVTHERGMPVDSSGAIPTGGGMSTSLDSALELADLLSTNPDVRYCLAHHWFRFAFGRVPDQPQDVSEVQKLATSLSGGPGDPQSLLLAIVESTSFRMRPAVKP